VDPGAVIGPEAVTVGKGAQLASRSTVYENVPAGVQWGGFPAKPKWQWMREILALERLAGRGAKVPSPPIIQDNPEAQAADI